MGSPPVPEPILCKAGCVPFWDHLGSPLLPEVGLCKPGCLGFWGAFRISPSAQTHPLQSGVHTFFGCLSDLPQCLNPPFANQGAQVFGVPLGSPLLPKPGLCRASCSLLGFIWDLPQCPNPSFTNETALVFGVPLGSPWVPQPPFSNRGALGDPRGSFWGGVGAHGASPQQRGPAGVPVGGGAGGAHQHHLRPHRQHRARRETLRGLLPHPRAAPREWPFWGGRGGGTQKGAPRRHRRPLVSLHRAPGSGTSCRTCRSPTSCRR